MNRWVHFSRTLVAVASLMVIAAAANAQGLNLSWNDCGSAGTSGKTFACTSNTLAGAIMIGSAVVGTDLPSLVGEESVMTVQVNTGAIPAWWQAFNGGCRGTTGMASSFDFTAGPFTCLDPWSGSGAGGMDAAIQGDGRLRIKTVGAIPGNTSITGTDEYYFFKVTLLGSKTTGNGSCAGCQDGACIVFNNLKVVQTGDVGSVTITTEKDRAWVTWQAGGASVPGGCPAATPTEKRTWGSVKSLYR